MSQTTNYRVYSLFVFNIAKYSSFPSATDNFKIAVLGKSKVYEELQKIAATNDLKGKKIIVSDMENLDNLADIQVVYLSDNKSSMLPDVIKQLEGKSVLIISEREGLFKKGAGFSFVVSDDNKLRVDINKTDIEKRNVKLAKDIIVTLGAEVI
jgi:hypothetical protein